MHQVHLVPEPPVLGPGMVLGFAPGRRAGGMQPSEPPQDERGGWLSMKSPSSGRKIDLPMRQETSLATVTL